LPVEDIGMREPDRQAQDDLLYVERVSGHTLRTRKDMEKYLEFLEQVHPQRRPAASLHEMFVIGKRVVFVALVAFSVFQYFAVDVVNEVMTIDKVRFLPPTPADLTKT
jgi:hypothetical protein